MKKIHQLLNNKDSNFAIFVNPLRGDGIDGWYSDLLLEGDEICTKIPNDFSNLCGYIPYESENGACFFKIKSHEKINLTYLIPDAPLVEKISSNFTDQEYILAIERIIELIRAGDVFQVNLTRKFFGNFVKTPQPFDIFQRLLHFAPAPFAAFIKIGDLYIISSSPELFLRIKNDQIESRPIKGSAPISAADDFLRKSEKNLAENLMITDLVRNDISRVSTIGSVRVENMFNVDSYSYIKQMSSSIVGNLANDTTFNDIISACFPPGSMTGAPKIRAMQIINNLEVINRGIYSGTIGYRANDITELSVVIRTIIIRGNNYEFQVGGGITSGSDPSDELEETRIKSKMILKSLGLELSGSSL